MDKIHRYTFLLLVSACCWLLCCRTTKDKPSKEENAIISVEENKKLSIAQTLRENDHLPVEERMDIYRRLKKENPEGYNFENEDEMTMYGYSFLWDNKVQEAIEVFKLIVEQFPNSSNPYDSLGEAYFVNGDKKLALFNYEKSLALNPNNFNAEDYIELIKNPDKKPLKPSAKFAKSYTSNEYLEDLDQLGKRLIEVNPNALKFTSEKDFWESIEEKKALINEQTTYSEFIWHCSEIIANVNCSHTSMGRFFQEGDMLPPSLRFPLQVRWVNEQLFVIDALNNGHQVAIKDEIVSINGVSATALIKDIYRHIATQGHIETTKKHFFNTWATGMIPYALSFPETYEIEVKGRYLPIVLNKASAFNDLFRDPSIKSCEKNLCLEFLDNNKNAVLTISSFNYYPWNNLQEFKDFIDQSFKEIKNKGVKNLVVDLRFNGGGSPESSIYLLKYLTKEPFTYFSNSGYPAGQGLQIPFDNSFTGKCYFIIDGNGNSTTGHFMALVKDLNLGTIIGEELGSNQFCTGGQTVCRLSHTKLQYYVANSTSEIAIPSLPDERGILPDHYVTQGIDDYVNKVDAVKEFTLALIEK